MKKIPKITGVLVEELQTRGDIFDAAINQDFWDHYASVYKIHRHFDGKRFLS
jgi:hypothetical protein